MPGLSVEEWRAIIGYNPWHFWQMADNTIVPVTSACNSVVYQHNWQDVDAAGRADIFDAIEEAEALIAKELGFWPSPRWFSQVIEFPPFWDPGVWRVGHAGGDSRWNNLRLEWGQVLALGPETRSLVGGGPGACVYTDADGDGLDDTVTITIGAVDADANSITDPNQIHVYFQSGDRPYSAALSEEYRIHPLNISISGGIATITGRAWQFVAPSQFEGAAPAILDPTDSSIYVSNVDVYRHFTNQEGTDQATAHAVMTWNTVPYPHWAICCDTGSSIDNDRDPAALAYAMARANVRDQFSGLVEVGSVTYDATTATWNQTSWAACRPPSTVTVRYYAGQPLDSGLMERKYRMAVARLAAAILDRPICACEDANRELYRWQFDLSRAGGAMDEQYQQTPETLDNPFGPRRGHVAAWKFVKTHRALGAHLM